jgi:hypothetical protein
MQHYWLLKTLLIFNNNLCKNITSFFIKWILRKLGVRVGTRLIWLRTVVGSCENSNKSSASQNVEYFLTMQLSASQEEQCSMEYSSLNIKFTVYTDLTLLFTTFCELVTKSFYNSLVLKWNMRLFSELNPYFIWSNALLEIQTLNWK